MITIRPATKKDVPIIEAIYVELYKVISDLQPDYYLKAEQNKLFIEEMVTSKDSALLFAESDGKGVGFIIVQQQKTPPYAVIVPHRYAYIIDLAVTEKSRGMGVGTKLVEAANDWAKSRNLDYIELGVLSNNKGAKKLYEKLSFEDATVIMRCKL